MNQANSEPVRPSPKKGRKEKCTGKPRTAVLNIRIKPDILAQLQGMASKCKADGYANWTQADIVEYALRDLFLKYKE